MGILNENFDAQLMPKRQSLKVLQKSTVENKNMWLDRSAKAVSSPETEKVVTVKGPLSGVREIQVVPEPRNIATTYVPPRSFVELQMGAAGSGTNSGPVDVSVIAATEPVQEVSYTLASPVGGQRNQDGSGKRNLTGGEQSYLSLGIPTKRVSQSENLERMSMISGSDMNLTLLSQRAGNKRSLLLYIFKF